MSGPRCDGCDDPATLAVNEGGHPWRRSFYCGNACVPEHHKPHARPLRATLATMTRGRPPQDDATRDRMLRVRVTADQEARFRAAADAEGLDLSSWLRELADERAAKVLGR